MTPAIPSKHHFLARLLGVLAIALVTVLAGCTTYPEVERENLWAVEHPHAFDP